MQLSELDDYSAKFKSGKNHLPDVILVRKCYPKVWKRMSKRMWKLKHLEKEELGEDCQYMRRRFGYYWTCTFQSKGWFSC